MDGSLGSGRRPADNAARAGWRIATGGRFLQPGCGRAATRSKPDPEFPRRDAEGPLEANPAGDVMSTGRRMIWILSILLVVGGGAYSCFPRRSELLQEDSETTRRAVLKRIPLGTDASRVQLLMETEGFKCKRMKSKFYDDSAEFKEKNDGAILDVIYCDSGEITTKLILVSKRWQVSFVEKDGLVAGVRVGVGLTGL